MRCYIIQTLMNKHAIEFEENKDDRWTRMNWKVPETPVQWGETHGPD